MATSESAIQPGTVRAAVEQLHANGLSYVKSPRVAQAMGLAGTRGDHVRVGRELGELAEEGVLEPWCPSNGTQRWRIVPVEER